ncbi:MAG: rod shape-determining protein MreC [Bacteroidota bacterium]|nr:rod shape-determining protein MreC [Bacteroidota bacterium]
MLKVFEFLLKQINFIIFLVLETLAGILIITNNPYQGAAFFNSSNSVSASMANFSSSVKDYMNLKETNSILATENARLRYQISKLKINSFENQLTNSDTNIANKYKFVAAKVINNSTVFLHNYLTINKGLADSISPGMGVICSNGIVGKVKSCSKDFATITSLLHKDMIISSKLKRQNVVGSTRWSGNNPKYADLMYVPRHIKVLKGDTVVTSEFNSVFPEGEPVGIVSEVEIKGDESFYKIKIKLATDFYSLDYVYVIKNKFRLEQDTLEASIISDRNERK